MFWLFYQLVWIIYDFFIMSFNDEIITILTALGVMLAAIGVALATLAVMVGIMAVWGYGEMKKFVKLTAEGHVARSMEEKLKQYPTPDELIQNLQNQLLGPNKSNRIATPLKTELEAGTSAVLPYPGEEVQNADNG
jgi:hypothetical protein